MGLEDDQREAKTYLSIVAGKVAQRLKEHIEQDGKRITVERKTKDKDDNEMVVIERQYSGIGGLLQKAEIKEGKFGHQLIFEFIDKGNTYHLSVQMDSSYGRGIMYKIPNIDPNKKVTFRPFNFINDENEKIVGVSVLQEGRGYEKDKVPPKWTQKDMGDLPELLITEGFGGKKNYDGTARMKYLAEYFLAWAADIGGIPTQTTEEKVEMVKDKLDATEMPLETDHAKQEAEKNGEIDDLPF